MSVSIRLRGPRAKHGRAKRHFDKLCSSVAPAGQKSSDLFGLDSGRVRASIPVEWSLMIGDCVHNLRSALDHLIWEAVIFNGTEEPGNRIEFPIFPGRESLPDDLDGKGGKIEGAGQKVRDIIDGMYPCGGGNTPLSAPLCLLHRLDIEDKHKTLAVVWATTEERANLLKVVAGARTVLASGELPAVISPEEDVELFSTSDTTPDQYVEASVQIIFGKGHAEGRLVVPTLLDLIKATNEVIDAFEAQVFSTSAPAPKTSPR